MKKRICVIFGGRSGEHEISIRSARTVLEQADPAKYELIPICIEEDGRWLGPADALMAFDEGTQAAFRRAHGEPERFGEGSTALAVIPELFGSGRIDAVFPVLHGTNGEDGTIQGLFEMADVAYVGCGMLASSCGMDKTVMKTLFRDAGLAQCDYVWFLRDEWNSNRDATAALVGEKIGFPCFVKPANLGSSVGVSKATDRESLDAAIELAAEYDRKIIVEEAVPMREIECAVMGNSDPRASLPGEYIIREAGKSFLDYTEKYAGTGNNEFVVPAPISEALVKKVQQMAVRAFKAIDGSGLARVDFFLRTDNGSLLVNEINTMPGLTDASGFPKMWQGTGSAFPDVIDELIRLGLERHEDKKRNKTSRL
ncbi:MAG: D-alanine--D-alanine ligase [Acidobacteria bacterium]|nr:D-alanine--D-alanine ligase [Acidobacteriota bacterium]MCW5950585.1 D-alanine--D-alanine ligase [Pyrinomonadaceae bacterium]